MPACRRTRVQAGRSPLARHAVIAYDDALARTPGGRWLEAHGAGATIAARTNNVMTALDLAATGLGLTAAPVNIGLQKAGVRAILRPVDLGASTVFLVTHRDLAKVPRIRATMNRLATDVSAALAGPGAQR
jgi:DNA-binding transcriptional LysR family regulator